MQYEDILSARLIMWLLLDNRPQFRQHVRLRTLQEMKDALEDAE